jgi:glycosyltransferase involved in cell wall biosynthesis
MLESELPARGIEVETVPFGWVRGYPKAVRHIVYAWKLWRASKGADIIYALDPISVGLPAVWVARWRRVPFLVRLGGDYAWEQGRVRFGLEQTLDEYIEHMDAAPFFVRRLAALQTYVVSRAERVVVPSKYLKGIVHKWGVPSERIRVIYSALYPLEVRETRATLREQLGYAHPTIVSAGRLVPWKGFRVLIEVIARLRERYPHIALVIVGDGEERGRLEALVNRKHLGQHVRFTGSISKDALGATVKAADVFVLNTAYEGLSHQLIEVMDLGVPIVTTTAGGNPELITDGMQGYLVPFNDQELLAETICRVLDHPESRERMTQSARARSKDFEKGKVVEQLVQLLHSVYDKELG